VEEGEELPSFPFFLPFTCTTSVNISTPSLVPLPPLLLLLLGGGGGDGGGGGSTTCSPSLSCLMAALRYRDGCSGSNDNTIATPLPAVMSTIRTRANTNTVLPYISTHYSSSRRRRRRKGWR